jgi:hypothetical protein
MERRTRAVDGIPQVSPQVKPSVRSMAPLHPADQVWHSIATELQGRRRPNTVPGRPDHKLLPVEKDSQGRVVKPGRRPPVLAKPFHPPTSFEKDYNAKAALAKESEFRSDTLDKQFPDRLGPPKLFRKEVDERYWEIMHEGVPGYQILLPPFLSWFKEPPGEPRPPLRSIKAWDLMMFSQEEERKVDELFMELAKLFRIDKMEITSPRSAKTSKTDETEHVGGKDYITRSSFCFVLLATGVCKTQPEGWGLPYHWAVGAFDALCAQSLIRPFHRFILCDDFNSIMQVLLEEASMRTKKEVDELRKDFFDNVTSGCAPHSAEEDGGELAHGKRCNRLQGDLYRSLGCDARPMAAAAAAADADGGDGLEVLHGHLGQVPQ